MQPAAIKSPDAGQKLRVFIADDSASVRNTLVSCCSVLPQVEVVGTARDGGEALRFVRRLGTDVLILDIRMPKLNGFEVLKALRDERLGCAVIILSNHADESYRQKARELGALYVFDKTKEWEKVLEVLQTIPVPTRHGSHSGPAHATKS